MRTKLLFVFLGLLFIQAAKATDPPVKEGKTLFMSRCAACHNVNKVLTGPALAGVDQRRSMDWIINFVHSSQSMVKKGDKEAVALFEKFKVPMPDHPDLTSDNIKSIVEYIKSEAKSADEKKASSVKPAIDKKSSFPFSFATNLWPSVGLVTSGLLLISTLIFARKVSVIKKRLKKRTV